MNTQHISFRTKTHKKSKSNSLSQQFVRIEKVLTEYEKKKFHPKIENFQYMATQTICKNSQQKKFLLKKDRDSLSTEKLFGPLPPAFQKPKCYLKTQKSYDITQITLASSQERQTYVKMSKIRNPEKFKKIKEAYPKYSQRYLSKINKNFMQLLGKPVQFVNSNSSREMHENGQKTFIDFNKERNILETKTQDQGEPLCKKYAQIQIDQLLQNNTKLTTSQKRRITEYNKRSQSPQMTSPTNSIFKRRIKTYKINKNVSIINEPSNSTKKLKTELIEVDLKLFQEEPLDFSSNGWLIEQHNDTNIITI